MKFDRPLVEGILKRRYKRFLADVELAAGEAITAHCPNTGSLMGCAEPGSKVWLSRSSKPGRKYPYTWELVQVGADVAVGINTGLSNHLVREGIESGTIAELDGYGRIRREVRFGRERSRVDLLLEDHGQRPPCYLEVKNVTAAVSGGVALFPDAVSVRGSRHLRELMRVVESGARAALCFCVQRHDVGEVRPADEIDPEYGRVLRRAMDAGVEVLAYRARVSPREIRLEKPIPVVCP
jgi:sugar fermentation stimulation protein A